MANDSTDEQNGDEVLDSVRERLSYYVRAYGTETVRRVIDEIEEELSRE